jgi:hypothetical protein
MKNTTILSQVKKSYNILKEINNGTHETGTGIGKKKGSNHDSLEASNIR